MKFRSSLPVMLPLFIGACGGASDGSPGGSTGPVVQTVATVIVSGTAGLEVGKTIQLSAQARDAGGAPVSGKTFAWSSASDAIATVTSDGIATGKAAGATSITASVDGKTGSLPIVVSAALPVVASVVVSGASTLQAGATTKLVADVKDAAGNPMTGVPIAWSSSDPTLLSVSGDGTVSALRIATVNITATAGGKTGSLSVTSSLTPYTFSFADGTSAADAQAIKDAVQYGSAFYLTTMGRTITTPTTVAAATTATGCDSRNGNAAFTGPGTVTFCVANQGWLANGPISRQKITVHELFHVWQFQYKWLGNQATAGPTWLIEGAAELMGYNGISAKGLLPIATTRGCMAKQVSDFARQQPPGLPALSTLEPAQVFQTTVGPAYAYSLIAVDELTATPGLVALKVYGDAIAGGTPWQTAFQTAFGTSISAFYAQFPAYLASQPVPVNYLCGV